MALNLRRMQRNRGAAILVTKFDKRMPRNRGLSEREKALNSASGSTTARDWMLNGTRVVALKVLCG
jgi:hypothetical protein